MATFKTRPDNKDSALFVRRFKDQARRKDCEYWLTWMADITDQNPVMWGDSIIGYGSCLCLKRLDDVNLDIPGEVVADSVARMKSLWPAPT